MGSIRRSPATVPVLCLVLLVASVGWYRTAQAGEQPTAPELPGVEERFDGLYDADGCLRTGLEDRDCSVTAEEIDVVLAGDSEDDVRHLAGFTGSGWTEDLSPGRPVVLEDTVTVSDGAEVDLTGLVRNESERTLGAIEVTATLRGVDGRVVAVLSGPAAVGSVRSGEPVPFTLTGPSPAAAVERIEWSASVLDTAPAVRDLEWQSYWEQPAGDRDPVVNHLYGEDGPGPHPHVAFGSVRNVGSASAPDVVVVTAWLGDDGRVAAVASSTALDPAGRPVPALDGGQRADALLVSSGVPIGAEAITWVSAS